MSLDELPFGVGGWDWSHCCIAHDFVYWIGGDAERKAKADADLRTCMENPNAGGMKSLPLMGWAYEWGVYLGGAPRLLLGKGVENPFPWRWGFGWKVPAYNKLTDAQHKFAKQAIERLYNYVHSGEAKKKWKMTQAQSDYLEFKLYEQLGELYNKKP
jgi:hypothetical protein